MLFFEGGSLPILIVGSMVVLILTGFIEWLFRLAWMLNWLIDLLD